LLGTASADASLAAAPAFADPIECFADEPGTDDAGAPGTAAAKPCRPCKDRPWCECTYQGAHRVSCDPCCYQDYAGQIICFD
jgi:hypothetical protein